MNEHPKQNKHIKSLRQQKERKQREEQRERERKKKSRVRIKWKRCIAGIELLAVVQKKTKT